MSIPVRAVFAVMFLSACAQTYKSTPEYINAPVNLSVKMIATQTYELSFYSDNREGNFAGYGLFTSASAAALNTSFDTNPPAQSDAAGFCTLGAQGTYGTVVAIQTGPGAASVATTGEICELTTLTLTSGSYVALRARVERMDKPWSAPAIGQVP